MRGSQKRGHLRGLFPEEGERGDCRDAGGDVLPPLVECVYLWWLGVDDVNDRPVGNPKRRCDEYSSK
jgi:hypothetical protein